MKDDILLTAGLGEEVINSLRQEKMIRRLTKKLEEMIEENINTEEMARRIITSLLKDENYE
jgi:hypothetical protein